ncbi:MAG: TldD/PmbA family protein [Candidatus Lokiarchaeota archaeon]|nr:TldD/PmbA family protein [Candidatus Harpocratesius repetitus]
MNYDDKSYPLYSIENLAQVIEREIKKANITKWDIYLYHERINGIHYRKTDIEEQTNYCNLSYFIRVFQDIDANSMGVGSINLNATSPSQIQKAIQQAKALTQFNIEPKYDLVSPGKSYADPITYDKNIWEDPVSFLESKGKEIQQNLREIIPAKTTSGHFRYFRKQKMLINSNGFKKLKKSSNFSYEFSFKAEKEGKIAEYWPRGYVKLARDLNFDQLVPEWATRAKDALNAQPPQKNEMIDVIFAPELVRKGLLTTVGYAASARAFYEKLSKFHCQKQVAVNFFTLIDDGLIEGGLNTSAWDSEGNPKQRTVIINKGIMEHYLFDQKYATLLNRKSTGNAQLKPKRGGSISIEINNLVVEPGKRQLREIVEDCRRAILVINFPWLHPNAISGDFGASIDNAYMIENGQLTTPIRGGIISGNFYEMLNNIDEVSKETRLVMNAKVPYIKFKGLRLSSEIL